MFFAAGPSSGPQPGLNTVVVVALSVWVVE